MTNRNRPGVVKLHWKPVLQKLVDDSAKRELALPNTVISSYDTQASHSSSIFTQGLSHLNRQKIESNLSVPAIQGCHENGQPYECSGFR